MFLLLQISAVSSAIPYFHLFSSPSSFFSPETESENSNNNVFFIFFVHESPHHGLRRDSERQLPLHPRRLHRPNLEPQRPFQQPQLRSGVCPHRRHRREPHRLPRLLFQLLPLLQPRRPRPQAGHPPLPHHLLPLPRRRRPPRRGRQPHRPPPRHARLRRRIRRRLRLPHARARQRGADQARNPRLRKLTHLRRRRSASHLRPPRAPHLRLPRSLRLHTLAR